MVLFRNKQSKQTYKQIREKVLKEEKISKQKKRFGEKVASLVTGRSYETRLAERKAKAKLMVKVRAARQKAHAKELLKQTKKRAVAKVREKFAPKKKGSGFGQISPEAQSLLFGTSATPKKKGKKERSAVDKLMWGN